MHFLSVCKKVKLEYLIVLLFLYFHTALPPWRRYYLHNDGMLFTVGGKVVYFRISLPQKKRSKTGLPAKLLSGIVPYIIVFVFLGKVDLKALIQMLLLSFACFLVSKMIKKDKMSWIPFWH